MARLEEKLGELSGKLDSVIPVLNRIGERTDENRDKITALETEVENIKNSIGSSGAKRWDMLKIVFAAVVSAAVTAIATAFAMGKV